MAADTTAHNGHGHGHTRYAANAQLSGDPTGTKTLRERRFVPEMNRRFRRVRGLVRRTVGYENDAFGLKANADPAEVFDFPTDPQKRRAFEKWFREAIRDEVLERAPLLTVANGEHWTAKYIRGSYTKAVRDAERRLRAEGIDIESSDTSAILTLAPHKRSIKTLYTRTYSNLEDITDDAAGTIRDELIVGLDEGVNPREMARRINDQVSVINATRARTLARTEIINAYTEATLDRYQRAGIQQVSVQAEWSTAGDSRVCPICASLEGRVMTIEEARTGTFDFHPGANQPASLAGTYQIRPPAHPSCRCALLPITTSANAVVANDYLIASPGVKALAAA